MFDPSYWEARSALVGQASGRGTTWFVQQGGEQWALRHYRRGGWIAKFVTDRYLWLGLARTRAWREWHLTAELHRKNLPVPTPVAARVVRSGLSYRADLITRRIADVEPLSQRLQDAPVSGDDWRRLGELLRRLHDTGLDHADLNAHNVLQGSDRQFWLIDFDRARLRTAGRWRERNLRRLLRSLRKLRRQSPRFCWTEADWAALQAGYEEGGSTRTGRSLS
jgi:3-deoxy-D-manno-octulosonic acid kinase